MFEYRLIIILKYKHTSVEQQVSRYLDVLKRVGIKFSSFRTQTVSSIKVN